MIPTSINDTLRGLQNTISTKAQNAFIAVLATGPVPRHIAFEMDGNRRYARHNQKVVQEGHAAGFEALKRMLEICMHLNVRCVTAYAFAIENFKRTPEEVGALMDLAEEKLTEMSQHGALLDQHGIRLNVLGKKKLLPARVQLAIRNAEEMTRKNDKAILNLCMPYAASDDMATAVQSSIQSFLGEDSEDRVLSGITEDDIDKHLMTTEGGSPPLDILIRTSGVKRLSDFLLWQCCENTQIQFTSGYWPDFGFWDIVPILLDYQRKAWASSRL